MITKFFFFSLTVLDPYVWNILPESLVPTATYLVAVGAIGVLVANWLWAWLVRYSSSLHQQQHQQQHQNGSSSDDEPAQPKGPSDGADACGEKKTTTVPTAGTTAATSGKDIAYLKKNGC